MPNLPRRALLSIVGVTAVVALAGCGGKATWDDFESQAQEQGLSAESTECVMKALQDAGHEADEFTDDNLDAAGEAAIEAAFQSCISFDDATAMLGDESVREAAIAGFVEAGVPEAQATCIFDALTEAGLTIADMQIADPTSGPVAEAMTGCLAG